MLKPTMANVLVHFGYGGFSCNMAPTTEAELNYQSDIELTHTWSELNDKFVELLAAYPLQELREKRNVLLAASDWRDLPSYAGTRQAEWRVYRQSLRDMTSGLDTVEKVNAATFPTKPS